MLDLSEALFFIAEGRNGGRQRDYRNCWSARATAEYQKTEIMGKGIKDFGCQGSESGGLKIWVCWGREWSQVA